MPERREGLTKGLLGLNRNTRTIRDATPNRKALCADGIVPELHDLSNNAVC